MDPVLLPVILDVADELTTHGTSLSIETLNARRRANNELTLRRFAEIGRVLESIGIARRHDFTLTSGPLLSDFASFWDAGNLSQVNKCLRRYMPYNDFLALVASEGSIKVPPRSDSEARKKVGAAMYAKSKLTFVAIDTFKWWALAVGQVYISHIGTGHIYWGGANPSLEEFESAVLSIYPAIRPPDGYANVGRLADHVCRELHVAFICFEELFAQLCKAHPEKYRTSTSLSRNPTTKSLVQTLLPRSTAKQRSASLHPSKPIDWTEKRSIEDGVMLGRHNVKMIRIEEMIQ